MCRPNGCVKYSNIFQQCQYCRLCQCADLVAVLNTVIYFNSVNIVGFVNVKT